jgi:phenylpropionate dioxygenase-like ring-hydroxylating dioxygenase large terminal subunit
MTNQLLPSSTLKSVPDWAKALSDEAYFAQEQACLGAVWTFLGFESDIPNVNDWFRTTLGGRSIFIQRFKDGLKAFENICPHRFNQIRCEDKGNGHVICGFHHWQFNSTGDAVGIPKCKEYYGKTPAEIGASLNPVELSVCGGFIFGRFGGGESLKSWLGDGYDILAYVTKGSELCGKLDLKVKAHWKLMMQIGLDDYHIVAVHPATFGKNGYLKLTGFKYHRIGVHSTVMMASKQREVATIAQQCREGSFFLGSGDFLLFQFFPTLVVILTQPVRRFGDDYCYLLIQHNLPESHDHTLTHSRFYLMPFSRSAGFVRRLVRKVTAPFIKVFFKYYMRKVTQEDIDICENIQQVAHQIDGQIQPSALEERLGWFEEVYAKYVTDSIKQK